VAAKQKGRPAARAPHRQSFRLAGLGTALVGAALLAAPVLSFLRDVEREKSLLPAQGTVIEVRQRSHGAQSRDVVTVRFTTASGQAVRFERAYAEGATSRPAKGDTVTVLYDPERPTKAEIQDTSRIGHALVGAVGAGFLLVGLASLTWTFRQRARADRA
jgi:hypothetical protein